jgi:hypothetical protein
MKSLVRNTIDRIYFHHDHQYFLEKSQAEILLPHSFWEIVQNPEFTVTPIGDIQDFRPDVELIFEFNRDKIGEFQAVFTTRLKISKIAPLFHVYHEFGVKNKAIHKFSPTIDGYGEKPYVKRQLNLDDQISHLLTQAAYTRLNLAEMNEVVFGLSFPEGVTIFGSQVTVEYALFHDLLGICPD